MVYKHMCAGDYLQYDETFIDEVLHLKPCGIRNCDCEDYEIGTELPRYMHPKFVGFVTAQEVAETWYKNSSCTLIAASPEKI
jgi:hypothetical protein